jgi:L-glutamine---4-(methylsulfanyl)-2-oxobutanoate aminotransferase
MAGWHIGFAVDNAFMKSLKLLQDHLYVSLCRAIQQADEKALLGDPSVVGKSC